MTGECLEGQGDRLLSTPRDSRESMRIRTAAVPDGVVRALHDRAQAGRLQAGKARDWAAVVRRK